MMIDKKQLPTFIQIQPRLIVVKLPCLDRAKIYAGYGHFEDARAACEQGLQLHFSYGTESLIPIRELSGWLDLSNFYAAYGHR